jgi:hypothetical protein
MMAWGFVHTSDYARVEWTYSPTSGDADGLRASKPKHAREGMNGKAISVMRRRSVREREAFPITCLSRLMVISTEARRVYPDLVCHPKRPCSVML